MEIYKIPSCWPSSFVYGISVTGNSVIKLEMLQKENQVEGRYKEISYYNSIKLDINLIDFIFQFCSVLKCF